jgi:hypothetical protein
MDPARTAILTLMAVTIWRAQPLAAQTGHQHAPAATETDGWSVATHAHLTLAGRWDPPPRGRKELFGTNMAGVTLARPFGSGRLELSLMGSLEPLLGADGYPLLLQTGETADGATLLVDRQHPHDMLMAVEASYRFPLVAGIGARVYAAPVGAPTLGPVPFMRRESAGPNPTAPISHHFLDATHITHGVVAVSVGPEWLTLEGSVFNGREPDRFRWTPDGLGLDSHAARLTVRPHESWSLQASIGELSEPERLHPGIDLQRITVSASHRLVSEATTWATTVAWGRNRWDEAVVTYSPASAAPTVIAGELDVRPQLHVSGDGHEHPSIVFVPELTQAAWLAETALSAGWLQLFARYEHVEKNELFPEFDPRHRNLYDVSKVELGLLRSVGLGDGWSMGFGGSVSLHRVDQALEPIYGNRPRSYMLFVRLDLAS